MDDMLASPSTSPVEGPGDPLPKPYDEKTDAKDIFWDSEPWDENLPSSGGFIRDFVFATRGMETPTSFSCWCALFLLSSVLRRDAWLRWFPSPLFANLFVILVAPPRICGKSTVTSFASKLLHDFSATIKDPIVRTLKTPRIIQNKATPEALLQAMESKSSTVTLGTQVRNVNQGSQVSVIVPELETFLGKQKYNEGLIGILMDVYDCRDTFEYYSVARGTLVMKDIFVTFLGGTTPSGLDLSVNDAAFGQGFMSRMVVVYEARSTRCFPRPRPVEGAPTSRELSTRLGWVAKKAVGEYDMDAETDAAYQSWYRKFRGTLEGSGEKSKMLYRMDNILLKLCILIRANRYEEGTTITLQDFKDADKILTATYRRAFEALDSVGASDYHRHLRLAERKIREVGKISRREILTSIRWDNSKECTNALNQLYQEGKIKIVVGDSPRSMASINGKEEYIWIGAGA